MDSKRNAPSVVAHAIGAVETFSSGVNSGVSSAHSTLIHRPNARPWRAAINLRQRLNPKCLEYFVRITNGITFVGLFGGRTDGNSPHAKLKAEIEGALRALDWLRLTRDTPAEVRLSVEVLAIFIGASGCPHELRGLVDKLRRSYLANEKLRLDCESRRIVTQETERVAA